jgi:hypothetical protein
MLQHQRQLVYRYVWRAAGAFFIDFTPTTTFTYPMLRLFGQLLLNVSPDTLTDIVVPPAAFSWHVFTCAAVCKKKKQELANSTLRMEKIDKTPLKYK